MATFNRCIFALFCFLVGSAAQSETAVQPGDCGTTVITTGNGRVVGGQDAAAGQWPWQAMVQTRGVFPSYSFVCGGTLVNPKWVITAAHCLESNIFGIKVIFGAIDETITSETSRQTRSATHINHPDYISPSDEMGPSYFGDISLLQLDIEVTYTDWVRPACLPSSGSVVESGIACIVSGFGDTKETGDEDLLQYAEVRIIPFETCDSWYGGTIPVDHVCAGYELGGVDTCQGDSGGPLVCPQSFGDTSIYFLRGITSFGIGCAEVRRPGVYTDVATYMDWIGGYIDQTNITEGSGTTLTTTTTSATTLSTTSGASEPFLKTHATTLTTTTTSATTLSTTSGASEPFLKTHAVIFLLLYTVFFHC